MKKFRSHGHREQSWCHARSARTGRHGSEKGLLATGELAGNTRDSLVSLLEVSESERGCDNSIATGGSLDTHCRRHVLKVTLSVVWYHGASAPDREVNSVKLHVIPRLVRRVSARAVSSPTSH